MGTVTLSNVKQTIFGDSEVIVGEITMSNSYATGGDTAGLQNYVVKGSSKFLLTGNPGGYNFHYDETNDKIIAYTALATQPVATTDLSAIGNLTFMIIA